jgi:hypothetical protein
MPDRRRAFSWVSKKYAGKKRKVPTKGEEIAVRSD